MCYWLVIVIILSGCGLVVKNRVRSSKPVVTKPSQTLPKTPDSYKPQPIHCISCKSDLVADSSAPPNEVKKKKGKLRIDLNTK